MLELLQMLGQTFSAHKDCLALEEIDPESLAKQGYRAMILDVDNTVACLTQDIPTEAAIGLVERAKRCELEVVLLSNVVFASRADRVEKIAAHLDVNYVCAYWPRIKPHPEPFIRALELAGVDAGEAVMIGDQLIADIIGARQLGMGTILVEPIGDWHLVTWIIAALERFCCRTLGRS
jgi:HAD superfamily phosphatase (TIGR01668 family)